MFLLLNPYFLMTDDFNDWDTQKIVKKIYHKHI